MTPATALGALAVAGASAAGAIAAAFVGGKMKAGEPDILVRHPDGALYVTLKFNPSAGQSFEQALEQARRYAARDPRILYMGIRRTDVGGHPYVVQWSRKNAGEAFSDGEWLQGQRVDGEAPHRRPPALLDDGPKRG